MDRGNNSSLFLNFHGPLGLVPKNLFGASLVGGPNYGAKAQLGAKGFLKSRGAYLGSAFGTSTPTHVFLEKNLEILILFE